MKTKPTLVLRSPLVGTSRLIKYDTLNVYRFLEGAVFEVHLAFGRRQRRYASVTPTKDHHAWRNLVVACSAADG